MSSLHQRIEKLWWQRRKPPLLLRCIEPIYRAISHTHLQRRASRSINPPLPLISIGNITAGGSGKTPFTLWLAGALQARGIRPVILCRGDGGTLKQPTIVRPDDRAARVGDEAKMLASLSSSPVIAAADRVKGASLAAKLGDIIILDDGFQYRHLSRCCDIVLIPAEGTGNGYGIPAGPLREPLCALNRADLIVRTGSNAELQACARLGEWGESGEWHWSRQPGALMNIGAKTAAEPEQLMAVTAIARPERFLDDLNRIGYVITKSALFPDHYQFNETDVARLTGLQKQIVVTAKDAVKLQPLWPDDQPLWVLPLKGDAEPALVDAIIATIPSGS